MTALSVSTTFGACRTARFRLTWYGFLLVEAFGGGIGRQRL
jgi:hypothetical protein